MRTASILLALVVVLGFVREAGALTEYDTMSGSFCVEIGGETFGFADWLVLPTNEYIGTTAHLGPFGSQIVPFTAIQGLIGLNMILALLVIVPAVLTVRWKRKQPNRI
jgi:hypothetical protein